MSEGLVKFSKLLSKIYMLAFLFAIISLPFELAAGVTFFYSYLFILTIFAVTAFIFENFEMPKIALTIKSIILLPFIPVLINMIARLIP